MYIEGASLHAAAHDSLMLWVNIVTISAFLAVNAVLVYFIIRYRYRSENDSTARTAQNTLLEVTWTTIPAIIMAWLYIWGLTAFIKMRTVPENAMSIQVTAQQWAWSFVYPSELRKSTKKGTILKTTNVLYLEEGKATKLVMKSKDVIHSFFVPAFRVKEDVVPNMFTYTSFTPVIPQKHKPKDRMEYTIYCAEYCGKDHSAMMGKAVILSPKKFLLEMARIEKEAGNIQPERGKAIFKGNCRSCHTLDGTSAVGPTFKGLWQKQRIFADGTKGTADENYIRNSILNPNSQVVKGYAPAMPPQEYNDAEIRSIIEYLKTVK